MCTTVPFNSIAFREKVVHIGVQILGISQCFKWFVHMLSDTWLKTQINRTHERAFTRSDRDGLGARISPKGKITFQVRYRLNKKPGRMDVGSYPATSLKKAREYCAQVNRWAEEGHDPRYQRLLDRQEMAKAVAVDVRGLFSQWYESYCKEVKANPGAVLATFELHVFPAIGKLPADKATTHTWMTLLEKVKRSAPSIAERILVNAKQMYRWGFQRNIMTSMPLQHIYAKSDLQIKKNATRRILNDKEIMLIWDALNNSKMSFKNSIFTKLCLMYGCRNGELRLSNIEHWDMDNQTWIVPAKNHKTGIKSGKPIIRPYFGDAIDLVGEAILISPNDGFGPVFCNSGDVERMSNKAPLQFPYNIMQWVRKHHGINMEHWSMHDLRRTMRTRISAFTRPDIAEMMVGHVMPGEQGVYDHHNYLSEQRESYCEWWALIKDMTAK